MKKFPIQNNISLIITKTLDGDTKFKKGLKWEPWGKPVVAINYTYLDRKKPVKPNELKILFITLFIGQRAIDEMRQVNTITKIST